MNNPTANVTWSRLPAKSNGLFRDPCHLSTRFCENRLNSFCIILLTNQLTNADENIAFLAEVNMVKISKGDQNWCGKPQKSKPVEQKMKLVVFIFI